jgi:hypothetical protein
VIAAVLIATFLIATVVIANSSDSKSSSLLEVNVFVLNGTENVDLTVGRENRNGMAEKKES